MLLCIIYLLNHSWSSPLKNEILDKINSISSLVKPIDHENYNRTEVMLRSHSGEFLDQGASYSKDVISLIGKMVNKQLNTNFNFNYEPIRINNQSLISFIEGKDYVEIDSTPFFSFREEGCSNHHKKENMKDICVFFIRRFDLKEKKFKDNEEMFKTLIDISVDVFNLIEEKENVSLKMICFLMKKSKLERKYNLNSKTYCLTKEIIDEEIQFLHSVLQAVIDYKNAIKPKTEA